MNAAQLAISEHPHISVALKTYYYGNEQFAPIEAYKMMIADKCSAIVGYEYLSDLLLVEKYQTHNIPIFSTYSSSLSSESTPKNIISFVPYYNYLPQKMIEFLKSKHHLKKVLIVTDVSRDEMIRYKAAYVSTLISSNIKYSVFDFVENDHDYLSKLQNLLKQDKIEEVILLTGAIQSSDIINHTYTTRLEYVGTETFGSSVAPTMFVRLKNKDIHAYLIRNLDYEKPSEQLKKFQERYRDTYKVSPTILSVYTYDSVNAIFMASQLSENLVEGIYRINTDFISGAKMRSGELTKSQNYVILNVDQHGYHIE